MFSRMRSSAGALLMLAAVVGCTDSTAPQPATGVLALKGGTGGGGGGGGGVSVGSIITTSGTATCDKGSTYAVTIRKGDQKRAALTIVATASAVLTGPAIPPSTLRGTSLGGYTTWTMTNDATGALLYGVGRGIGYSAASFTETVVTTTLPVGTTPVRITWLNQQLDGVTFQPDLSQIPVYETCTLLLNVSAK